LAAEDHNLLLTSSVADAFEIFARHEIGVVLCDQRMPQMTGVEFLSKIRTMYPNAVRVLMSAYDDFGAARDAINRGAVSKFLGKPWERVELKVMLDEAFQSYQKASNRCRSNDGKQIAQELLMQS